MNIGTDAAGKTYGEASPPARYAGSQLSLPLEADSSDDDALRAAWIRSGLPMPYHVALRNRPLAICLSCLAEAMRKKVGTNRSSAARNFGSKRSGR